VRIGIATGLAVVGDLIGSGSSKSKPLSAKYPISLRACKVSLSRTQWYSPQHTRISAIIVRIRRSWSARVEGFAARSACGRCWAKVQSTTVSKHLVLMKRPRSREEELEALMRRWQQAKGGKGRWRCFPASLVSKIEAGARANPSDQSRRALFD